MENVCAFKNCTSYSEEFFYSPSDPVLLRQWQRAVETNETDFCVCISHFRGKDINCEKTLEVGTIPIPSAIENDYRLNQNLCGSCLIDLGNQMTTPTKETATNFYEITDYPLVTDHLCYKCAHFLKTFSRFKNDIKETHKKIRLHGIEKYYKPVPERRHKVPSTQPTTHILQVCQHCSYKSFDKDAFAIHQSTLHQETPEKTPVTIKKKVCQISPSEEIDEIGEIDDEIGDLNSVECFYCNKKFVSDSQLRVHQANIHLSNKGKVKQQQLPLSKNTLVIKSPRSLASSSSKLDKKRMHLLARLENSIKIRVHPAEKPIPFKSRERPKVQAPPASTSTRTTRSATINKKQKQQAFEIYEIDEIQIKEEEVDIKKEIEEEISAIEIRNVEDILCNKNRRKQNIAKEQLSAEVVFKEEPVEEEFVVAEAVDDDDDDSGDSSNSSSNNSESEEDEMECSLNYIPPKKNSKTTEEPSPFRDQVQCLDCGKFMKFEELADHREALHTRTDAQFYDDIRNSNLPPLIKKTKKKPEKSLARVACKICAREMQEWRLELHMEYYHSDKPQPYLCHVCCRTFPQITKFRYHMISHDPSLQFRCDLCGRGFITKAKLSKHIRRAHMNIYTVRGVCVICNQKMYKASRVQIHMNKYHPIGPDGRPLDEGHRVNEETNYFDCHSCGASYADLYTFKRHDCGKGRFQMRCPECNKPVKNDEYLQKHRETKCPRLNKYSVLNKLTYD